MILKGLLTFTMYIFIITTIIDETCNHVTFGKFKKIKNKIINLIFQFLNDSWIIIHYDSLYKKVW